MTLLGHPAGYVILSTQRTGSHLLGDILGSHPLFAQNGETLLPGSTKAGSLDEFLSAQPATKDVGAQWAAYLRFLARAKPGATYAGMLVKYGHIDRFAARDLVSDPLFAELRIVHLVRRNVIRTVVSHLLAVARGIHVSRRPVSAPVEPLKIEPAELLSRARGRQEQVGRFQERLRERPNTVELFYEDLMVDSELSENSASRLSEFFVVDDKFIRRPPTVKLAPSHLAALIDNYAEVSEAVGESEFAEMLE